MIIKGVFRRYQRWNPVHPTCGAFWGLGVGIGCGVGWGPGFGPEVIGYVGAGCGLGFSVGFTLLGAGIGLPANWLFHLPYNAAMATRSGLPFSQNIAPCITNLQREASGRFSSFKQQHLLDKGVDLSDLKTRLSINTRSISQRLEEFRGRFLHFPKGLVAHTTCIVYNKCKRLTPWRENLTVSGACVVRINHEKKVPCKLRSSLQTLDGGIPNN